MTDIKQLQQWINDASRIVFFGGAGVSTESGIPDFRSTDGLYHQTYAFPPETILSHSFYLSHTEEFYRFYRDKMLCLSASPNTAHQVLATLEKMGKLTAIITQNIDGLHQKAGSQHVLELHGSVLRNFCQSCHAFFSADDILHSPTIIPHCPHCGGTIKPDVVLYEESLDEDVLQESVNQLQKADLLLVGGTSLVVYPAAGLLHYYRGKHIVLLNKAATDMDKKADLIFRQPIGQVLGQLHLPSL